MPYRDAITDSFWLRSILLQMGLGMACSKPWSAYSSPSLERTTIYPTWDPCSELNRQRFEFEGPQIQNLSWRISASKHKATEYSPNYLLLGRETRVPLDITLGSPLKDAEHWQSYDHFEAELQEQARNSYKLARDHLDHAAEHSKTHYDQKVKPVNFSIEDWFLYYSPKKTPSKNIK